MVGKYAIPKEGAVENVVIADDNYSPDDFEVVEYSDETFCQSDMLYNKEDGLFYDDK